MMGFDNPLWPHPRGGYQILCDPRNALRALKHDKETAGAWKELLSELHHQGDPGEASYASVPHLVRIHDIRDLPNWNTYALTATIEEGRRAGHNPGLPPNLRARMKPRRAG